MNIERIDHLVLTVKNIETTVAFYCNVMGMKKVVFGEGRVALVFGNQKINLHQSGSEFEPKAKRVQPGSADLCFVTTQSLSLVEERLVTCGIPILDGPVGRNGAMGKITSVYFRDPDGNLIEVSIYD